MGFMKSAKQAEPALVLNEGALKEQCVYLPETVFVLGCDMKHVPQFMLENNDRLHLSMGNILDATPEKFVHLRGFRVSRAMVTNGEYLQFLNTPDPEGTAPTLFDRYDLWQFVWAEQGFGLQTIQMPYERLRGEISEYQEVYAHCQNFVDAYIWSIRYEVDRCLEALALEDEEHTAERAAIVKRLFACIRYKLGHSIVGQFNHPKDFLDADEFEALEQYTELDQVVDDIDRVVADCKQILRRRIDSKFSGAFEKDSHPIESFVFLWRIKTQLRQPEHKLQDPLSLRSVLYPRYWETEKGKRGGFGGMQKFPWEQQPVMGLTLYETLAFCLFLQELGGVSAMLPNEAEYERAASWPLGNGITDNPHVVDLSHKALYPWHDHNRQEFNFYFGGEGKGLAAAAALKTQYNEVREKTRRAITLPDNGTDSIYELTGFGWHWTMDRYDETERKYGRFNNPLYHRYDHPCVDHTGVSHEVFDYEPNMDENEAFIVLKGCPEIIGGPGLTTRRFAAYPLRGYQNVGFRWIIKDE